MKIPKITTGVSVTFEAALAQSLVDNIMHTVLSQTITRMARAIAESDPAAKGIWPEREGDSGRRATSKGWQGFKILTAQEQAIYRRMAGAALIAMLTAGQS